MKKLLQKWLFKALLKKIAKTIVNSENKLTPEYLEAKGWVASLDDVLLKTFFHEPGLKERDTIWIDFEQNSYRVRHGADKTFIACESSIEWFEIYYLMAHGDNGRYKLAKI